MSTVTYQELLKQKDNQDYDIIRGYDKEINAFSEKLLKDVYKADRVHIIGDFDCDGIMSSEIMARAIETYTGKPLNVTIGDRFTDGYGIPKDVRLEKGTLVICLDVGSSERNALQNILNQTKIAPYVIDHHEIADNMRGYAKMLNFTGRENAPDYCATGLAYHIYKEMFNILSKHMDKEAILTIPEFENYISEEKTLTALAGIGTVADMVSVNNSYDDNRQIILEAFHIIKEMENVEFSLGYFLNNICGIDNPKYITTETLQFNVVPLINAMGRIETNGGQAVFNAFHSTDKNEIVSILNHMKDVNEMRKDIVKTNITSEKFIKFVDDFKEAGDKNVAVYLDENLEQGIAGLVATELVKQLNVPAVCITKAVNGNYVASARNADGFPNMFKQIEPVSRYMAGFGGHESALGFSATEENLKTVMEQITENYQNVKAVKVEKEYLAKSDFRNITPDKIYALEPFGVDFPKVAVNQEVLVGEHRPMRNGYSSFIVDNMKFFGKNLGVKDGDKVHAKGTLSINCYRGSANVQVNVDEIKKEREKGRDEEKAKDDCPGKGE